jgi:hypothetical protein
LFAMFGNPQLGPLQHTAASLHPILAIIPHPASTRSLSFPSCLLSIYHIKRSIPHLPSKAVLATPA